MNDLFTRAGITDNDSGTRTHYYELGWFLSVCNRIAGYSLGNFEYSKELARLNAHVMGWHPSVINENFVYYFTALKEEKSMLKPVIQAIPENFRKNFHDNVAGFRQTWDNEVQIRAMLRQKKMNLVIQVEKTGEVIDANLINSIMKMYKEIHAPIPPNEVDFKKSLCAKETILITLRINEQDGTIVGYVNGGPLEEYQTQDAVLMMKIMVRITQHIWIGYELNPNTWEKREGTFSVPVLLTRQEIEDMNSSAVMSIEM